MSPPTGIILQPGGKVTCPSLRMHHVLTKRVLGGRGLPSEMDTSVTNLRRAHRSTSEADTQKVRCDFYRTQGRFFGAGASMLTVFTREGRGQCER